MDLLPNNAEGYPVFYMDHLDTVLCNECAQSDIDSCATTKEDIHMAIHWEGEPVQCEECQTEIESAYGPVEID